MSSSDISFCLAFHRAYAKLRWQLDEDLGTFHGIDFDDFALLHSLGRVEGDPQSLEMLAAELGVSRSAMLRRLRPLEKVGLVAGEGGVTDRRIKLRPAGHCLIKTAHDTVRGACDKLFLVEDAERLNEVLSSLN
jgi:DNA-binding MarR family transcriptional regulator